MKKLLIINANYYDNITRSLVLTAKNYLKKKNIILKF